MMNGGSNFDLITAKVHCVLLVVLVYMVRLWVLCTGPPMAHASSRSLSPAIPTSHQKGVWIIGVEGKGGRRRLGRRQLWGGDERRVHPLGVQYVKSSARSGRTITEEGQAYGGDETWGAGGSKERDGVSAVRRVEEGEELPNSDGWQDARMGWCLDDGEVRELQRQGGELCRDSRVDMRGLRWHGHLSCDG
ncbi:hypothetical protein V8D89_015238 [Ganoderma adspersum]